MTTLNLRRLAAEVVAFSLAFTTSTTIKSAAIVTPVRK